MVVAALQAIPPIGAVRRRGLGRYVSAVCHACWSIWVARSRGEVAARSGAKLPLTDSLMKQMAEAAAALIGGPPTSYGGAERGRHRAYEIPYPILRPATELIQPRVVLEMGASGVTGVLHLVTKKTNPDGTYVTYGYSTDGLQARKPNTQRTYSATGSLLETRSFTYDSHGNTLTETDPAGNTTTFTYNTAGLVTQISRPASACPLPRCRGRPQRRGCRCLRRTVRSIRNPSTGWCLS